jgi:hypothetical protein
MTLRLVFLFTITISAVYSQNLSTKTGQSELRFLSYEDYETYDMYVLSIQWGSNSLLT